MEQETKKTLFRGFYGNYQHNLDTKGRAFVTAKFKDGLEGGFMLAKGPEYCLNGYQYDKWQIIVDKLQMKQYDDDDAQKFYRFFVGHAVDCEVDSQGRFTIPSTLREYANLTKDISFVGMIDHFEIWDAAKWKEISNRYDHNVDVLSEKMRIYLRPST